ncbi:MAG: tRNA lysidine(34) synthetase TilS [Bacteroidia bacterium]
MKLTTFAIHSYAMQELLDRLSHTIRKHDLILSNEKVLVAVSGGPDSVFLVHALCQLSLASGLAHINYQLRGEDSEYEESLVRKLGKEFNLPVFVLRQHPQAYAAQHNVSLQVACRHIRYEWFESLMAQHGFDRCATAHHLGDQTESVLMSLVRGNSESVIHGIPVKRDKYIRPLSEISKDEILSVLDQNQWDYSIDFTNAKNDYIRNQFRNQVIPLLQSINPSLETQISRRLNWYEQQHNLIRQIVENERPYIVVSLPEGLSFVLDSWEKKYGKATLPVLLAELLSQYGFHGNEIWNGIQLIESQTGKWIETEKHKLIRTREGMMICEKTTEAEMPDELQVDHLPENPVTLGGRLISFQETGHIQSPDGFQGRHIADVDKIHFPIILRRWKMGDKMKPLGMTGNKKLSDIFIDEKFDPIARHNALVIEDRKGIIFLEGYRIAERVKISPKSRQRVEIVIGS